MMKTIIAIGGLVGAGAMANQVSAQPASSIANPSCSPIAGELAKAPSQAELSDRLTGLIDRKAVLAASLTAKQKSLATSPAGERETLEATIAELKDRIELNRIALSSMQAALALLAKREDNIAACESAAHRQALISRIAAQQADAADRQALLEAEKTLVAAKSDAAKKANDDLIKEGSSAIAYAKFALGEARIDPAPDQAPTRQADVESGPEVQGDRCDLMIDAPRATLWIGSCGGAARLRSARRLSGGNVAFPSSVLRPRGLTANLAGSSSDGTISITYADGLKFRRFPKILTADENIRVHRPWELGFSLGVTAKDGLIFNRDDPDTSIEDTIDGNASVKAGVFFNVYKGETLKIWNARAAKLRDAAIKACRKDQASGESETPSTCTGQSLTNWVYESNPEGSALLRPELAKQADSLYFQSEDDKPVWGGGLDFALSRSNFDHLDPAIFIADPESKALSDGGLNYATSLFLYRRLTSTSSKFDLSFIPSASYISRVGYDEGTKTKQFCPALTAGTPFVTGACPPYYTTAPRRIESWTPAIEVRLLTQPMGPIPSLGVAPKFSYESINGSRADRWRVAIPVLAFIEKEAGLNVGLEYSREWGGTSDTANAAGIFEDVPAEDSLKIVATKTFSLTGK